MPSRSSTAPRRRRALSSPRAAPLSNACGATMMIDALTSPTVPEFSYFAHQLRELRRRLIGKQLCLSWAVGCTDAAVSFWESGKRLPQQGTLSRILAALEREGATDSDLSNLKQTWHQARTTRTSRIA